MIRKLRMRDYAPDAFENPDLQCHYGLVESLALQRDEVERPEDTTMPDEGKMRERLKVKKISFFCCHSRVAFDVMRCFEIQNR